MEDDDELDFAAKPTDDDTEDESAGSLVGGPDQWGSFITSVTRANRQEAEQRVRSRRTLWDSYAQALRDSRTGELSRTDRIINALQAFGTPRRGGVWNDLAAMNERIIGDDRENRKLRREREDLLRDTAFKGELDLDELGAKYGLENQKATVTLAGKAMAASGKSNIAFDALGRARDKKTGAIIDVPGQNTGFRDEVRGGVKGQVDPTGKWTPYPENAQPNRGLPDRLAQTEEEDIGALGTMSSTQADVTEIQRQIANGELDLSLIGNTANSVKNALGIGGEEGAKYATFKTTLEKLRNDSLLLAKGVQTEGDAQRAWNALFSSISDPKVVSAQLAKIAEINRRSAQLKATRIQQRRKERGLQPIDLSPYVNVPSAVSSNPTGPLDLNAFWKK